MPPKKSAPSPQSDESDFSDFDGEQVVRKEPSKTAKSQKAGGNKEKVKRNAEEQMEDAANKLFDGSDGEDDDQDLFLLPLPPRPDFLTMPNNSNRLIILNVEVDNFKSYFGKASIGPFHKSFTSIIGPNGSGKSNLIDALLFVFGFRAAKIRSSKVANLIHKSRGREPESCTVTIYFQRIIDLPNQTYKVVDNSKFTISRTAYRNNSSSYAINGRAASKTEVEARLKLVDIDIEHNRFLILQGEVEQIAMMKPVRTNKSETGMVEYLEDIIGSNRLEKFVKLFQRRVNRLTCEQSQQRIAREHARGSKVAMEGQVRTAIEFLSKENEATTMHMKIEQRRRQRYLDKAAPLQAAIEEKKEERQKICVQLDSNKSEYSGMEDQEKKLSKEKSVVDKEIDKLTRELNELSAEETRRKETLKRYKADIQKSEAEKEKEVKKRKQLESVPEKAEKKIEKWKEEVKTLAELEETANAKADENLTKFGKETEKPKEEQKKIQEKWAEINAQYNTVRGEATVARDELEDLKKMATSGTKKLDDLKNRLENSKEKLKREKEEEAKLKPEFAHAEEEVKRLNTEWPSIRNELRAKQQEYARTRDRLEELHQQNKACSSGNRTVQMLMKEKAAGRIPSFIGRLGDQGFVDKKYDAMFSTNYASTLNRLIVGKEEDGAKILDFLHQNKLPRATVQPLDKIKPVGDRLRPAPPDRYPVSRLFDLVECEDELKPAFYDCLHETLAANSIAEAQKLLSHPKCNRNQFCTMDGASISANGNVTGGGRPYYGLIVTDRQKKAKQVTEEDRLEEKSLAEKVEILKRETEELRNVEQRVSLTKKKNEFLIEVLVDLQWQLYSKSQF
uniref:SMC hinge domain-containing protein n=1 Tax=Caenorhabditis japonica TaxID=281687 RepID=A0A8R1DF52_CAEJA